MDGIYLRDKSALPPDVAETGQYLQQVASAYGDAFCSVVELYLEADTMEKPEYLEEQETTIALRLQKVTEQNIVKKLEHTTRAL